MLSEVELIVSFGLHEIEELTISRRIEEVP